MRPASQATRDDTGEGRVLGADGKPKEDDEGSVEGKGT